MTQLSLHLEPLADYANSRLAQAGKLVALHVCSLAGGYSNANIYRVDLDFALETGEVRHIPVVWKQTTEDEVRVLRVLGDVPQAEALPKLIDQGHHQFATGQEALSWFVMPFYEAEPLSTTDDEVPAAVIDSLARLHTYFASRLEHLAWAPRFDIHAFRTMLGWVLDKLAEAQTRQADERLGFARDVIRTARKSVLIEAAFARLPVTLIHGDVHGGNILQLAGGGSVLIDWGNARLAPAAFDLANMVAIDSPNWQRYWATWQAAGGQAFDEPLARLGYHLATVMVNSQYLPFAVHNWPDEAQCLGQAAEMIERLQDALKLIRLQ